VDLHARATVQTQPTTTRAEPRGWHALATRSAAEPVARSRGRSLDPARTFFVPARPTTTTAALRIQRAPRTPSERPNDRVSAHHPPKHIRPNHQPRA
jgi:hypothetical protein